MSGFFASITDRNAVIIAIESGIRFPEVVAVMREKYESEIRYFAQLVKSSSSSAELLERIRSPDIKNPRRMALLKIFRRCVSGVCDTEATKKIKAIKTSTLIDAYGHTFKPISKLKQQFARVTKELLAALAVSVGEYDNRGQQGYVLTGMFFDWFEEQFAKKLTIKGPRGPGPDVELSSVVNDFNGSCPCDFVIQSTKDGRLVAVGFARYDSTRGGAQSDDRTGGNAGKVYRLKNFHSETGQLIRVIFLADGPGLTHRDTWKEACDLELMWDDNVRVTTFKLAPRRVTLAWMLGG